MSDTPATPVPAPTPESIEEWCKTYCPELPKAIGNIVAEWNCNDAQQAFAVSLILNAVRKSVAST